MKPAVINNTSETPTQTHHEPNMNSNNQANNGQPNNEHSRRFPQFRQHGFGFDDPDADVFADMGLRSRLNRMGNPFDWSARKRRGSGQGTADPYDHYFDDVDFPHFGSTWDAFGRMGKRSQHPQETNDRGGFFNYVPQEFRQYVPEHFGGYFRQHSGQPYMQQQQQQQSPQQPPPPHPQQTPQTQQPTQQHSAQPSGSKSNLCDAAIQTDDPSIQNPGARRDGANNTENNNRNGVNQSSSSASSSSKSTPYGNDVHISTSADGPGAHANASAGNNQNQYYQQSPNYGGHHQAPQYGRQYQQPYGQQYQYSQSPQQKQYYAAPSAAAAGAAATAAAAAPPQPPQPQPQPQQKSTSQEGFVRNVPIVFEETGTPINRTTGTSTAAPTQTASQTGTAKPRPEPLNKDSFAPNQPIPSDQPIPCPPPPSHNQQQTEEQHSDPSNVDSGPPQTPHTADCISKIQAIQRDVLDLMLAVEQFGGKRGDKDYLYLDEMLTRNLLKLDTIDTNGKESIRLARKEAIKCIQTSIAVLEAKSDLHLNEKRDSVDQTNSGEQSAENTTETTPSVTDEKPSEKMDVEQTNGETLASNSAVEENAIDASATEIPKVENISIDDKPNNDTETSIQTEQQTKDKPVKEKTPEIADTK